MNIHKRKKQISFFRKACRNGDLELVIELLKLRDTEKVLFDISCKGKSKSNLGKIVKLFYLQKYYYLVAHKFFFEKDVNRW